MPSAGSTICGTWSTSKRRSHDTTHPTRWWRAGCDGSRTSGSEGGGEETTGRNGRNGASPPTLLKPCSYGFRSGRRAHDAIAEIHMLATNSYEWVLEADIKACFDEISHVAVQDRLRARVADKRVMALIKAFLKAGIMTELGGQEETLAGTPQGGILSPLIANAALSALDEHFAHAWQTTMTTRPEREKIRRRGGATYRLIRYADDCVPRTLKEMRCRRRYRRMRCCTRDEGARLNVWWPFVAALQGEAANHREVRRSRAGVLSVAEKARCQRVRCGSRRRAKAIPPLKCRKRIGGIQNRGRVVAPGSAWREPADWPGGCPAWMVARAWSGLLCGTREPVAPMGRPACGAVVGCGRSSGARTPSSRSVRGRVVMRGTGADLLVVAVKAL